MSQRESTPTRVRWARLRFSIIGPLLTSPPESGELGAQLDELAERAYVHPATGERVRFGRSTIEHWLYAARNAPDPIRALERKLHALAGTHPSIGPKLAEAIRTQYRAHPRWSYQLHHDNLRAQARIEPALGPVPSRLTLTRYMKAQGLVRSRSKKNAAQIARGLLPRETRSYEVTHVGSLWHMDFHVGSRRVVSSGGAWRELTVGGVRYEIPTRYRTLLRPTVRWASWDLSSVDLVDERTGVVLATLLPLDKQANADGRRRVLDPEPEMDPEPAPSGIAPRLRELMNEYAATGLPPAYVPLPPRSEENDP